MLGKGFPIGRPRARRTREPVGGIITGGTRRRIQSGAEGGGSLGIDEDNYVEGAPTSLHRPAVAARSEVACTFPNGTRNGARHGPAVSSRPPPDPEDRDARKDIANDEEGLSGFALTDGSLLVSKTLSPSAGKDMGLAFRGTLTWGELVPATVHLGPVAW